MRDPQVGPEYSGEERVECRATVRMKLVPKWLLRQVEEWTPSEPSSEQTMVTVLGDLKDTIGEWPEVEIEECPFEGRVEVEVYRDTRSSGTRYWQCPLCDTEHADEVEMRRTI